MAVCVIVLLGRWCRIFSSRALKLHDNNGSRNGGSSREETNSHEEISKKCRSVVYRSCGWSYTSGK